MGATNFEQWYAAVAVLIMGFVAVYLRVLLQKLLISQAVIAYILYWLLTNVMALGKPIDFQPLINASWALSPQFLRSGFPA